MFDARTESPDSIYGATETTRRLFGEFAYAARTLRRHEPKVLAKVRKCGRLWLVDRSCMLDHHVTHEFEVLRQLR